MNGKLMGGIVACVSASNPDDVIKLGDCYGYLDEPSYCVKGSDGRHFNWAHTNVREATAEEQLIYWRTRAIAAESNRGEL